MSNSRVRIVLLAAILVAAAIIRLAWLESTPLWWDEFVTLGRAKLAFADLWRSLSFQGPSDASLDSSPPLLHLILHPVLALGAASETWVKLPSVLAGILTVLVLYPLGTRLYGGRSGLFASALLSLSLYHLQYSREARPYSLYLLLAATSLWLLVRALESNRPRHWALYAASLAGALYASYLGGANLLAQGLFLAGLAAGRALPAGRLVPAALALGAAALAYLPWLPGHLFHMELIYAPSSGMGLTWEFLTRALLEFTTQSVLLLACAGLGVFTGLWRNPRGTALVLCWLLLPVATALALRTGISVNPRYLINFVPGLALLAGAGLDGLVKGLSLGLPSRAAALLGLFAAVGLSWPSLTALPDYYRRDAHSMRDDLLDAARAAANADTVAFPRNRHLKVFTRWYLPGVFDDLSQSGDLRYRRVLLLCGPDFIPPGYGRPERFGDLAGFRLGLLNVSPLAGAGAYRADFSTLSFYREAALWENAGPDLFQKSLSLYDPERPGRAVWRFKAPQGGFTGDVALRCRLRLTRGLASKPSDASVAIAAGSSPETLTALKSVAQADFTGEELDVPLTIPRPSGPELAVGLLLDPGTVHGALEPVSLEVDFPGASPASSPVPAVTPDTLRRRADLAEWTPGLTLAGRAPLVAFKPGDSALVDFRASHPGLAPVAELPGPGGLTVFDPALADAFFNAPGAPGSKVLTEPVQAGGLLVKGPMAGQTVTLGGAAVQLPLVAPEGSTLALAPGGQGRIWAALDFAPAADAAGNPPGVFGGTFARFNTALVPGQPCLTCAGENACFAVYALASRAPVRAVRVAFTPEVYGEPGIENSVRLSVSTDGNAYRSAESLTVKNSELWEGKHRRIAWIRLERPSERVYLRFELSSDKARLWSGPEHPLRIDAWLEPAARMPRVLAAQPFTPGCDGRPVRLYVSPSPLPDLDRLLAPH
ncbi:glycosyltransferase family 39 protein [Fundidesulfovibrio terrae]|uniref:glycosyltransferase family 39 protein n=1 Tax=Fundidesulfovibrio terrae TaxID=2922866 RepID=UPI001FAF8794|nr:glycosyltransferase family 39 protein [Fundidesulfovibrio terrae]